MFIVFEGVDGCGKSTQALILANTLNRSGIATLLTAEPNGTELGKKLFAEPRLDVAPLTNALLFAASRAEHVHTVIKPALEAGQHVICDRFTDSSLVYQSHVEGVPPYEVIKLNEMAALYQDSLPDLIIYLAVPWQTAVTRIGKRDERTVDMAEQKVIMKAAGAYQHLYYAGCNPNNVKVLRFDGRLKRDVLARDIYSLVSVEMAKQKN